MIGKSESDAGFAVSHGSFLSGLMEKLTLGFKIQRRIVPCADLKRARGAEKHLSLRYLARHSD
jgi:hypothetical protein